MTREEAIREVVNDQIAIENEWGSCVQKRAVANAVRILEGLGVTILEIIATFEGDNYQDREVAGHLKRLLANAITSTEAAEK